MSAMESKIVAYVVPMMPILNDSGETYSEDRTSIYIKRKRSSPVSIQSGVALRKGAAQRTAGESCSQTTHTPTNPEVKKITTLFIDA